MKSQTITNLNSELVPCVSNAVGFTTIIRTYSIAKSHLMRVSQLIYYSFFFVLIFRLVMLAEIQPNARTLTFNSIKRKISFSGINARFAKPYDSFFLLLFTIKCHAWNRSSSRYLPIFIYYVRVVFFCSRSLALVRYCCVFLFLFVSFPSWILFVLMASPPSSVLTQHSTKQRTHHDYCLWQWQAAHQPTTM